MPRKKAEPEVLQEETVQPEITDIEELAPQNGPDWRRKSKNPCSHTAKKNRAQRKNCQNQANQRRNPSTIWTSVRSTRISRRSSGRSGTQSTLPSAAEASCAARSSASIRIP